MKFLRTMPPLLWGVSGLFLLFGALLRTRQYLFNRSIWLDEAFIATNLERSWSTLLQLPLDYSHSHIAPPGLLVLTKLLTSTFGHYDWVTRLFPFACSLVALWLFFKVAQRVLSPVAVPIAMFFFAISDGLILHAVNFKQYSSDVAISLLLCYTVMKFVEKTEVTRNDWLMLGVMGAVAVWFSHPIIFVLVTLGLYLSIHLLQRKQIKPFMLLCGAGALWVLSFLTMYHFISGGGIARSSIGEWLIQFWTINDGFMPPPWTSAAYDWLLRHYLAMFSFPAGFGIPEVAGILFLVGAVSLGFRKRGMLFIIAFPLVLAIMASALHKYPFADRLLLFLLPAVYLLLAEALVFLKLQLPHLPRPHWIDIPIKALLIISLVSSTLLDLPTVRFMEEIKPLLQQLQKQRAPQDTLYLYHWAEPAFRFYAKEYGFDYQQCSLINSIPNTRYTKEIDYFRKQQNISVKNSAETHCILGLAETFTASAEDIAQLRGKGRVWILFTHVNELERSLFLNALDQMGKKQAEWLEPGASLHLYELR